MNETELSLNLAAEGTKNSKAEGAGVWSRVLAGGGSFLTWRPQVSFFLLCCLLFLGAILATRDRDPFDRIWFKIGGAGQPSAECVAVLPRTTPGPLPVVIYLHGSGGSLLGTGNELRQMAEMGLAAVGMEYCKTNEAVFENQFSALLDHLGRCRWADTNRMAWVGYSLGAQRQLSYALRNPDRQPKLLVFAAGGRVADADFSKPISFKPGVSALLVRGELDEGFSDSDFQRLSEFLRSNGVPVESKVLAGQGHGLGPDGLVLFRVLGEYCLAALKGDTALAEYRSILSWQAEAKPLWVYWLPAGVLLLIWRGKKRKAESRKREAEVTEEAESGKQKAEIEEGDRRQRLKVGNIGSSRLRDLGVFALNRRFLWAVAAVLGLLAAGQTGLHLVLPHAKAGPRTLGLARSVLVRDYERSDFDFLMSNPLWRGCPLRVPVQHAHLAHYNRQLVNWTLPEPVYREFVLSPQIDPQADGAMDWRRPLWENFYPRIRRESATETAAEIVVRFLRERVTIAENRGLPVTISEIWERQITNRRGFDAIYVAALRACGVPARLDQQGRAEFWTGSGWKPAPRPMVEMW